MSDRLSRAQAYRLYMIAAVGLIGISLLAAVIPGSSEWITVAYYLICMALPVYLTVKKRGCIDSLRPDPLPGGCWLPVLLLPFLVLIVVNTVTLIWQIPFEMLGARVHGNVPAAENARELILSILLSAALPAVCEEFLFRGAILSALEPYGTKRAILITSLLFTLLHGSIIGAPGIFILGVVLGMIAVCTGSIYGSIIYHTLHNAITIVLVYMQRGAAEESQTVLEALGGASGLLSAIGSATLYGLPAFFFLRALVRRARMLNLPMYPRKIEARTGGTAALVCSGVVVLIMYALDILSMIPGVIE